LAVAVDGRNLWTASMDQGRHALCTSMFQLLFFWRSGCSVRKK
jgi:hypothetical protein